MKNENDKILYKDFENKYLLLDFFQTHAQLLFRRKQAKKSEENIDIVFKQVRILFVPDSIEGIEVRLLEEKDLATLKLQFGLINEYGYKVFELSDLHGNKFYVNAGAVGVFKNRLKLLDSSLGQFLTSDQNECLFWYNK